MTETPQLRELVDTHCDVFEATWSKDSRPSIAEFLDAAPPQAREGLFRELVALDLELRDRAGEVIEIDAYTSQFPAYHCVVTEEVSELQKSRITQEEPESPGPLASSKSEQDTDRQADLTANWSQAQTASDATCDAPRRIGRFEVLRELGRGGMGRVLLAHDSVLNRTVAIKLPLFSDREATRRFDREARLMATVTHPNVCPIHDVGNVDGQPYLAMAYIDGTSLATELAQSDAVAPSQAARLVRTLALAVHSVHEAGIVHRDLKPSNVMLDRDRQPYITDFGLASCELHRDGDVTQSGAVIGSPAYMAPELVDGRREEVGPWTDVYSLGVILYQLLCGRRPYEGSALKVLSQIAARRSPRLPSELADVSPDLEAVCLKAMAPNAQTRYGTAEELANALAPLAYDSDSSDKPARSKWGRLQHGSFRAAAGLVGLLVCCIAVAASVLRIQTPYGHLVVRADDGVDVEVEVLKDGESVVVVGPGNGWRVQVEAGKYTLALRTTDHQLSLNDDIVTVSDDGEVVVTIVREATDGHTERKGEVPRDSQRGVIQFHDSGQRLGDSPSAAVLLGDVDGDGDLDALVLNKSLNRIWINDGRGRFDDSDQRFGSWGGALGDLDGDGDLDAVVHSDNGNEVWLNDGAGRFAKTDQTLPTAGVIRLGDLDGDGDLDLVNVTFRTDCHIFRNDGRGFFEDLGQPVPNPTNIMCIQLGDIDADDDLDIVLVRLNDLRGSIWQNDGSGDFQENDQPFDGGSGNNWISLGDVDADGDLDAFVSVYHTAQRRAARLWINTGDGTFDSRPRSVGSAQSWHSLLGDLDGDGDLDIIIDDRRSRSVVMLNDGKGRFSKSRSPIGTADKLFTALGDLDGDGDLDAFCARDYGSCANEVWFNGPSDSPD